MQLLLQQQNFADQLLHLSELTNSANLLCEYFVGLSQWEPELLLQLHSADRLQQLSDLILNG